MVVAAGPEGSVDEEEAKIEAMEKRVRRALPRLQCRCDLRPE